MKKSNKNYMDELMKWQKNQYNPGWIVIKGRFILNKFRKLYKKRKK